MKKQVLALNLVCLVLGTATAARAYADDLNATAAKAVDDAFAVQEKKAHDWLDGNGRSPEFNETGIGIGVGGQHNTAAGNAANATATFRTHMFKEGTMADGDRPDVEDVEHMRSDAVSQAENAISMQVTRDYAAGSPKNPYHKLTDGSTVATFDETDVQRIAIKAEDDARAAIDAQIDARMPEYKPVTEQVAANYGQRSGGRPLYLLEGNALYNMIGKAQNGGAFTGISGSVRSGIGFSFKDIGKDGCNIYFLATGNASAQGYYKLEDANSARVAVGAEQGFLCQIAHTLTIMGSPSVQAGKFEHSDAQTGHDAVTDWLNYSARLRAIVDNKLYVSAETVLHPSMKGASDPGAHWEASENSLSVDYALPQSAWVAGADLKFVQFHDENGSVTGNKDIHDNSLSFSLTRAF